MAMIKITVRETGDIVSIQKEVAARYGLSNGDCISIVLWREIISLDFDEVMKKLSGDLLNDSQRLILEKWRHIGAKAGIDNLQYSDLLLPLLYPKRADTFMLLLAKQLLMVDTGLINMLEMVTEGHSKKNPSHIREIFYEALDDVDPKHEKRFREMYGQKQNA